MGESYTSPDVLESKTARTKTETKAKQYTHDESLEDLAVSEGEELDKIAARYTKAVELVEGSAKESYEEIAESQDLEKTKRGMKLLYSALEGQFIMNKELVKKIETEIKEKYQLLKEQKT